MMQTSEFLHDLFRAATNHEEFHARCLESDTHGSGCLLNATHGGACFVMSLDPVSPESFYQLTTEEDE